MAELSEILDFVSFVLRTDDEHHTIFRDKPVKRRKLYTMVLNIVHDIERRARAVALAGTYVARTTAVFVPTVEVGLIGFFATQSDPAALKRKMLLPPAQIDLQDAWRRFCQAENTSLAGKG
jgi:hypothetical protein